MAKINPTVACMLLAQTLTLLQHAQYTHVLYMHGKMQKRSVERRDDAQSCSAACIAHCADFSLQLGCVAALTHQG